MNVYWNVSKIFWWNRELSKPRHRRMLTVAALLWGFEFWVKATGIFVFTWDSGFRLSPELWNKQSSIQEQCMWGREVVHQNCSALKLPVLVWLKAQQFLDTSLAALLLLPTHFLINSLVHSNTKYQDSVLPCVAWGQESRNGFLLLDLFWQVLHSCLWSGLSWVGWSRLYSAEFYSESVVFSNEPHVRIA